MNVACAICGGTVETGGGMYDQAGGDLFCVHHVPLAGEYDLIPVEFEYSGLPEFDDRDECGEFKQGERAAGYKVESV